jgi:hypothetical protein
MPSKPEIKILEILSKSFEENENLFTQQPILYGSKYKLLIDFTIINCKGCSIHLEYSGMNYFKKYLKLVDITISNNVFTIFDDENLEEKLQHFIDNINEPEKLRVESLLNINRRIKEFTDEIEALNMNNINLLNLNGF